MVCKIYKCNYNTFFFSKQKKLCLLYLLCLWSQNLESVREGPCHECQCQEGHVTCYQHSCPTCPLGTLTIPHREQCCPDCNPGETCIYVCLTAMMNYKLLSLITVLSYEYVPIKSVKLGLYYELEKGNLIYLHLKNITLSYSQFNNISLKLI